jgi:5-methylcytosine-specific restriction endonuclease McrA
MDTRLHPDYDPSPLYAALYCELCDQRTGEPHLGFCREGRDGQRRVDWNRVRQLLARDDWTCRYCGHQPERDEHLHIDHVRPRSAGGTDAPWNLVTACQWCNCSKGAWVPGWLACFEAHRAMREAGAEDAHFADLGAFD